MTRLSMGVALWVWHRQPIRMMEGVLAGVTETATAGASTATEADQSED